MLDMNSSPLRKSEVDCLRSYCIHLKYVYVVTTISHPLGLPWTVRPGASKLGMATLCPAHLVFLSLLIFTVTLEWDNPTFTVQVLFFQITTAINFKVIKHLNLTIFPHENLQPNTLHPDLLDRQAEQIFSMFLTVLGPPTSPLTVRLST